MKLLDYFLVDHISRKNARMAVRELEKREESLRNAREAAETVRTMARFSPVATFFLLASWLALVFTFFTGRKTACWISLYAAVCSMYVVLHNSLSWGRGLKYYIPLALCSALSFSGIYALVVFGRDKTGIALAVAGFVAMLAVAFRSSSVHGTTDERAAAPDGVTSAPPVSLPKTE